MNRWYTIKAADVRGAADISTMRRLAASVLLQSSSRKT